MSKEMERLVEEIAALATFHRRGSYSGHIGDMDKEFAEIVITCMLKAVADGMPLLDEVGRGAIWVNSKAGKLEVCRSPRWREPLPQEGYFNFIALQPEEEKENESRRIDRGH